MTKKIITKNHEYYENHEIHFEAWKTLWLTKIIEITIYHENHENHKKSQKSRKSWKVTKIMKIMKNHENHVKSRKSWKITEIMKNHKNRENHDKSRVSWKSRNFFWKLLKFFWKFDEFFKISPDAERPLFFNLSVSAQTTLPCMILTT